VSTKTLCLNQEVGLVNVNLYSNEQKNANPAPASVFAFKIPTALNLN
jgi:hypothetical protein